MTKKTDSQKKETVSLGSIAAILIVAISFVIFYLDFFNLNTTLYKVLVLLVGVVIATLVFFKSAEGLRFNSFLKETRIELRKVVWPGRDETLKTTGMILVAVVIVSIFLWVVDAFFSYLVQLLTK